MNSSQRSSLSSPGKNQVHIPSTWSYWDLDSASDFESEEDEEVEEVLLPAGESEPSYDHHTPISRRNSLLLAGELGDDLPGAKARKVMGISSDSWFVDSDEEEVEDDTSSTASTTRAAPLSLKNAFKRSMSLSKASGVGYSGSSRGSGHRRGASYDGNNGGRSETIVESSDPPKRRPSFSSVLGVSTGSSSPFFSNSPRMRASPSPMNSTRNLLKFRSSPLSPKSSRTLLSPEEDFTNTDMESEWGQKLDEAAKAAKWQTSIEHRPKQKTLQPKSARFALASPLDLSESTLKRGSDETPAPSLSPALSKRLSQMADASLALMGTWQFPSADDSSQHSTVNLKRRPSRQSSINSTGFAPPRPPKSSLRGQGKVKEAAQTMEFLEDVDDDREKVGDMLLSSNLAQRSQDTSRRESNNSSRSSDAIATPALQSPGLSLSSSTTHSSGTDLTLSAEKGSQLPLQKVDDLSRLMSPDSCEGSAVYSPFTRPRQAPCPPDLEDRQGLGLHLGEVGNMDDNGLKSAKHSSFLCPPTLVRQDSSLDPEMIQEGPVHHRDRPASVPFSPPSTISHELTDFDGFEGQDRDELLWTIDKLESSLVLDQEEPLQDNSQDEMNDYFERCFNTTFQTSPSPNPAIERRSLLAQGKALPSPPPLSPLLSPDPHGWQKYTEKKLSPSPDEDRDAVRFFQTYC